MKLTTAFIIILFTTNASAIETTSVVQPKCRSAKQVKKFKAKYPCPSEFIVDGKCTGRVDHVCAGANVVWTTLKRTCNYLIRRNFVQNLVSLINIPFLINVFRKTVG